MANELYSYSAENVRVTTSGAPSGVVKEKRWGDKERDETDRGLCNIFKQIWISCKHSKDVRAF